MSPSVFRIGIAAALFLVLAACGGRDPMAVFLGNPDPDEPKMQFTREKAIDAHLKGRSLAEIEGVWAWADKLYEVVIFRGRDGLEKLKYPDWDYVGLITDYEDKRRRTEVKLLLKPSSAAGVYEGVFMGPQGQRWRATFNLTAPGRMETTVPNPNTGDDQKIVMFRTYPEGK